jgi:rod shape-determining protein MreC
MNVVDRTLMRIAVPIEYIASALTRGISTLIGDYVYLVDVRSDNDKLAYENSELRARVSQLTAVEVENQRLRGLLALRDSVPQETVSAVVLSKDTTDYFRVTRVTLDRPGVPIKESLPVIGVGGVVGTVQRIAGEKVDVQLAVDSGFGVDVVVERTRARGFVRGIGNEGQYAVHVEYVRRDDEIDVGDVLITSGYGCRFPAGIPVAKVTKVVRREFGIYQRVEARPTVDFSRLNEVLIILNEQGNCAPEPRREPEN